MIFQNVYKQLTQWTYAAIWCACVRELYTVEKSTYKKRHIQFNKLRYEYIEKTEDNSVFLRVCVCVLVACFKAFVQQWKKKTWKTRRRRGNENRRGFFFIDINWIRRRKKKLQQKCFYYNEMLKSAPSILCSKGKKGDLQYCCRSRVI